jgi:hypothetical protein
MLHQTGEHRELTIYKLEEAADLYQQVLGKRVDSDTAGKLHTYFELM